MLTMYGAQYCIFSIRRYNTCSLLILLNVILVITAYSSVLLITAYTWVLLIIVVYLYLQSVFL